MKKFLFTLLLVAAAAFVVWKFVFDKEKKKLPESKQQPVAQSKYSPAFNASIGVVMTAYYRMTDGFVNWDVAAVNKAAGDLKSALDSVSLEEVKKDTVIFETARSYQENAKTELAGLLMDASLDEKRAALNILSGYLYDFLRTVQYDAAKVYLQECPMAFDDVNPGNWLSYTDSVRNPYLGMHHPKYGKGMLTCGGPKDTLNFMTTTTAN